MMRNLRKWLFLMLCCLATLTVAAEETGQQSDADSLAMQGDSLVQALRVQIQDLQLQGIMMKEQLEQHGMAARNDSLLKVRRQARIDSLREITPGVPLIVDGDTLFLLYNRRGGVSLEARVEDISEKILAIGKSLSFFADSIYVYDGDFATDIMGGEESS